MPELVLESLSPANVAELVEMFESVDRSYFSPATVEAANQFLLEPEDVHLLGRVNRRVVAFGMLRGWHEGFDVPSLGIAVRRDSSRVGYGRAMMGALEEQARARGARRIRLRVHPLNHRARRLYVSRGYNEAGMERGEVLMILDLATQQPA